MGAIFNLYEMDPLIKTKTNILHLDRDPSYKMLSLRMRNHAIRVFTTSKVSKAYKILFNHHINVLICDVHLKEGEASEVILKTRFFTPHLPIIITGNTEDMDMVIETWRNGANDFIKKPFDLDDLKLSMKKFIHL